MERHTGEHTDTCVFVHACMVLPQTTPAQSAVERYHSPSCWAEGEPEGRDRVRRGGEVERREEVRYIREEVR